VWCADLKKYLIRGRSADPGSRCVIIIIILRMLSAARARDIDWQRRTSGTQQQRRRSTALSSKRGHLPV